MLLLLIIVRRSIRRVQLRDPESQDLMGIRVRLGNSRWETEFLWSFFAGLQLDSFLFQAGVVTLGVLGQAGAGWPAGGVDLLEGLGMTGLGSHFVSSVSRSPAWAPVISAVRSCEVSPTQSPWCVTSSSCSKLVSRTCRIPEQSCVGLHWKKLWLFLNVFIVHTSSLEKE